MANHEGRGKKKHTFRKIFKDIPGKCEKKDRERKNIKGKGTP